jgi:hypothetical protein
MMQRFMVASRQPSRQSMTLPRRETVVHGIHSFLRPKMTGAIQCTQHSCV